MSVTSDIATELHNIKTSITTALGNKGVTSSGQWKNFKSEIEKIVTIFDISSGTDMSHMFSYRTSLTTVPLFNTGLVTNMSYMFSGCTSLTTVPAFNTGAVTNMNNMFYNCTSLTTVPAFNTSAVASMSYMFSGCTSLTTVDMFGMKVSFNLTSCTRLSTEEINKIFNNCGQAAPGAIITLPNTDNAKSADNSIATAKGWTIAYA